MKHKSKEPKYYKALQSIQVLQRTDEENLFFKCMSFLNLNNTTVADIVFFISKIENKILLLLKATTLIVLHT